MQKGFLYTISLLLFIGAFSCKKDYEYESEIIPPPTEPDFYATGTTFFDEVNSFEFDYQGGEFVNDVFQIVSWGSASAVGEEDGKKYIVSVMSADAKSWRNRIFQENGAPSDPIGMLWSTGGLYIKLSTDRPASEIDRKFSKEELEELLQVGHQYDFGTAPGEIEIACRQGFMDPADAELVNWGHLGVRGQSDIDNEASSFTILDIESYEDLDNFRPTTARGFKVKVQFDAILRNELWIHTDIFLENVNGVFFFEHE